MYVVAITKWGPSLETELPYFASELGETAYDLRRHLAGALPVLLARVDSIERAGQLVATLRSRGHGAVACDESRVARSEEMLCPSSYLLEGDVLVLSHPSWGTRQLRLAGLTALVVAMTYVIERTADLEQTRQFSMGRAVLTGGLVATKRKSVPPERAPVKHERVLYVIDERGDPFRLAESALSHDGLGPKMKPTAAENFSTLVEELRIRAPRAFFDDRLVHETRFRSADALGSGAASNVSIADLYLHLLVTAHVTGQL